jgi:hypothetical protein
MSVRRSIVAAATAMTVAALAGAEAQEATGRYVPRRVADGQPDLQGTWVNFDSTPFEPAEGPLSLFDNPVNPPAHWADHDSPMSPLRRSMVVDPPDGRVRIKPWAEEVRDYNLARIEDAPHHETPWVRCITRGVPGGMLPAGYNNGYEIIQVPGYVVIVYEMIHETRLIPLDGRPHVGPNIRMWTGDARGHWEGDTLVVETRNFNDKGVLSGSAAAGRLRGIPHSEEMVVVERFTRVSEDVINYSATISDPKVYDSPWTVALPLNRDESYTIFEYACHEGNLAMANALRAGRVRDGTLPAAPPP